MSTSAPSFVRLSREVFRRWFLGLILIGLIPAILFLLPISLSQANTTWAALITYVILYVIYSLHLVSNEFPNAEILGISMPVLAAFLTFGLAEALVVVVVGALLSGILLFLLPRDAQFSTDPRRPIKKVVYEVLAFGLAIPASATLYTLLGGARPLAEYAIADILPVTALALLNFAVANTVYFLIRWTESNFNRQEFSTHVLYAFLIESVMAVPAVFLATLYHQSSFASYGLLVLLVLLVAFLLRTSSLSRLSLDRRAQELATLNVVSEALATAHSSDSLFNTVYEQVNRLFEFTTFYIALYDPQRQALEFPLVVEHGRKIHWPARARAKGPTEHILKHNQSLLIADHLPAVLNTMNLQPIDALPASTTYMGVPIYSQQMLGVLALQHNKPSEHFSPASQRLLETIALQTATSLHNIRLLEREQQLRHKMVSVNEVSNIVNASLELPTILKQICKVALQLSDTTKGAIFLKSRTTQGFDPVYSINLSEKTLVALAQSAATQAPQWEEQIASTQPIIISDLDESPQVAWLKPLLASEGIVSVMIVPLSSTRTILHERALDEGDIIGFQAVFCTKRIQSDPSTINLLEMLGNQAAIAIENANLFEETQHAVKRLAYMAEATRIFTGSLELDQVGQSVVDWLADALELDSATLVLLNDTQDGLEVQAHARGSRAPLNLPAPDLSRKLDELPEIRETLRGRWTQVYHASEPDLSPAMQQVFKLTSLRTLVFTPLIVREDAIGLLVQGLFSKQPPPASDINIAESIANQAATAIQNAQFYYMTESALAERVMEMAVLETVLRRISASVDSEVIIKAVLDAAHTVTRADLLSFGLLKPNNSLAISWRFSDEPNVMRHGLFSDPSKGVIGRVLRSGEPVILHNVMADPDYWAPEESAGFASEICVPILYEHQALGIVNLESKEPGAFSESHLRFLKNLAGHAAIAMERARLFASNQRQIDTLNKIRVLSLDLLETPQMDTVLDRVCDTVMNTLNAVNVHLYFFNAAEDQLTFAASQWHTGERNVEVAKPRANGLTRQALRNGQPIISDAFQPVAGVTTQYIGSFPLKHSGEVVGVLNVAVEGRENLGEDETRAMELLTNQAAIAIERVRLFEDRQRQIEVLEQLRELSMELLNAPKLDNVLHLVCHTALMLTDSYDVHLYFYDEPTQKLTFGSSLWRDGRQDIEFSTPRPNGLTYTVAQTGKTEVIGDARAVYKTGTQNDNVDALIGIPLKHAGQVVGVLIVAGASTILDENEVRALELLANQSAAAILTVRLYEEVSDGRDRMQAILNTVRDGLALVDHQGRLIQFNPAAESFLGIDIQAYLGKHVLQVMRALEHQGWQTKSFMTRAELHEVWREFSQNPHKIHHRQLDLEIDGHALYLEEESAPVLDEHGEPIGRLFVWHDVTDARALEDTRTELTHTIVHDLRSPLTAIKGGLAVVNELINLPDETETIKEILEIAENSTDGLLTLVESLLDVARLESGDVPLELTVSPIASPIKEAVALVEMLAQQAEVTLEVLLPENLPSLLIDIDKMRRVFINLLDNALRYTPSGKTVTVQAAADREANQVLVKVIDEGPGIPAEVRERVFERFATGITGLPRRGRKGLGLGLTFCRLAVDAHGGSIWVEDGPQGGAAFCVMLPLSSTQNTPHIAIKTTKS